MSEFVPSQEQVESDRENPTPVDARITTISNWTLSQTADFEDCVDALKEIKRLQNLVTSSHTAPEATAWADRLNPARDQIERLAAHLLQLQVLEIGDIMRDPQHKIDLCAMPAAQICVIINLYGPQWRELGRKMLLLSMLEVHDPVAQSAYVFVEGQMHSFMEHVRLPARVGFNALYREFDDTVDYTYADDLYRNIFWYMCRFEDMREKVALLDLGLPGSRYEWHAQLLEALDEQIDDRNDDLVLLHDDLFDIVE